ncbi:putative membrane protein [Anoxybacillus mongoliensis]|uniref:Putative membrane protein n=1 Tax=Anoxybacillus mongoliensis TaxID=452565 RepID=A0A7W8NA44_9BACL|nr:PH domain-containing protein [Anoxybacillus mongoliensis]MBB5356537.1 putative membrane protein [Anoxybacillus mongoliensis]MCX8003034.1 PH domain-containing protein [Anoxybacillus mongoliensis]
MMHEKKRLHPIAIVIYTMKRLKQGPFLALALLIAIKEKTGDPFVDWLPLFLFLFYAMFAGYMSWRRFTYRLEEHNMYIEQGIFVKKKRYIPFDRIQGISHSSGLLQRLVGVVQVHIETAGRQIDDPEVVLPAVSMEEADQIERAIRNQNEGNMLIKNEMDVVFTLRFRDVLFLAVTSGGAFSVIAAIGALLSDFDNFIPFERLNIFFRVDDTASTLVFLLVVLMIAYVLSVIGHLFRYMNFTVVKQNKTITITTGLLQKKSISTSIERVQAIAVKESPIRYLFGYVSVHLIHAGGALDDGKHGSLVLFPLVRKNEVTSLVATCFPEYRLHNSFRSLCTRARWRYMLRSLYTVMLIPVITIVFFQRFETLLLLLPAVHVGYRSYRRAGVTIKSEQLALRSGWLTIKTVYMLKHCIQSLTISQTRMQQRLGLCTVRATVMPGIRGKVVDVDEREAKVIYEWFLENKE